MSIFWDISTEYRLKKHSTQEYFLIVTVQNQNILKKTSTKLYIYTKNTHFA